jgi:shikimate kinase
MTPKLILTGFMATGKSAVARVLVRRLSWRLLDCDAEIVKRAGKPIAEIFRVLGEDYFRALERAVIVDIANDNRRCPLSGRLLPAIVATGGGAIVDLDNFAALNRAGVIVCLTARPEGGSPIRKRIAELIAGRSEAYARAPVCVDTSDLNIDQAASAVLDAFTAYGQEKWVPSA